MRHWFHKSICGALWIISLHVMHGNNFSNPLPITSKPSGNLIRWLWDWHDHTITQPVHLLLSIKTFPKIVTQIVWWQPRWIRSNKNIYHAFDLKCKNWYIICTTFTEIWFILLQCITISLFLCIVYLLHFVYFSFIRIFLHHSYLQLHANGNLMTR